MKRSPIRRTSQIQRRTPINPRRDRPRRGHVIDESYLAWVRTRPCCARGMGDPCWGRIDPHHAGIWGATNDDRAAIPLCRRHHRAIEWRLRPCDWTRPYRRSWVGAQIVLHRAMYEGRLAAAGLEEIPF